MAFQHGIVLAHGYLGFGDIDGLNYFRGVSAHLTAQGHRVLQPPVDPKGSVQERSASLAKQITAWSGGQKVHVIAHSMGGLDVRYLLQPKGGAWEDLFASVSTLCTPHLGTPLTQIVAGLKNPGRLLENPRVIQALMELPVLEAELIAQFGIQKMTHPFTEFKEMVSAIEGAKGVLEDLRGRKFESAAKYIRELFSVNDDALADLEPGAHLTLFSNAPVAIPCFCYTARAKPLESVSAALVLSEMILTAMGAGDNDGLVPDTSASAWGEFVECFPADHIGVVGWGNTHQLEWFDRIAKNISDRVPGA